MEVHDIHSNIMSISETEQLIRQGHMCQNYVLELRRLKEPKNSKEGKVEDAKKLDIKINDFIARLVATTKWDTYVNRESELAIAKLFMLRDK